MGRLERYISGDESQPVKLGANHVPSQRLLELIRFWSQQMSEHALFMEMGLEDPALRKTARDQHINWESLRKTRLQSMNPMTDMDPVIDQVRELCLALRSFKMHLVDRMAGGDWIGWLWPSFVDHMRRELDYFVLTMNRAVGVQPRARQAVISAELGSWVRFMREHAGFASHLVDPDEFAICDRARDIEREAYKLEKLCPSGSDQLISLSRKAGEILDQYLKK